MIQVPDGTAINMSKLIFATSDLLLLENAQLELGYSNKRAEMIRNKKDQIEQLISWLKMWGTEVTHALDKAYPSSKMLEIKALV